MKPSEDRSRAGMKRVGEKREREVNGIKQIPSAGGQPESKMVPPKTPLICPGLERSTVRPNRRILALVLYESCLPK
jgi:hypothetical protein